MNKKIEKFFRNIGKQLNNKITPDSIAKFAIKETVGCVPFVGQVMKDAIEEFSPDEKEELIKDLKRLSKGQFKEISDRVGVSIEYLKVVRKITLYAFGELHTEHEGIKALLFHLIKIQTTKAKESFGNAEILENFRGEKVLRKGRITEPKIFRPEGPLWIDFENGMVAINTFNVLSTSPTKKVLFKDLLKNRYVLLSEPSSSGKSVLLRYICYRLCKKGKQVYFIELKRDKFLIEKIIEGIGRVEWSKLGKDVYFLIDDIHLDISHSEQIFNLIDRFIDFPHIFMASRDISFSDMDRLKEGFKKMDGLEIKLEKGIISRSIYHCFREIWSKKNGYDLKIRYSDVSPYSVNLWLFVNALQSFAENKGKIDKKEIFEYLYDSINSYHNKASCILLALANFYAFELFVDEFVFKEVLLKNELKFFLEKNYEEILNILIKNGLVYRERDYGYNEFLSIPHSSLALLYIECSTLTPFGSPVVNHFGGESGKKWRENFIYQYLLSNPNNSGDFVIAFGSIEYYEDALSKIIMKSSRMDNLWVKSIRGIRIKENVERRKNIGWAFLLVRQVARYSIVRARKIMQKLSYRWVFQSFMEAKDLSETGFAILRLIGIYRKLKKIINDERFIKVTADKIKQVGGLNRSIAVLIVALKLFNCKQNILNRYVSVVNLPDTTGLRELINQRKTLSDKALLLAAIYALNNRIGDEIWKDVKYFIEKEIQRLNCEDKAIFNDVGKTIFYIATFDKTSARKLINKISLKNMRSKMIHYVSRIYTPGISLL